MRKRNFLIETDNYFDFIRMGAKVDYGTDLISAKMRASDNNWFEPLGEIIKEICNYYGVEYVEPNEGYLCEYKTKMLKLSDNEFLIIYDLYGIEDDFRLRSVLSYLFDYCYLEFAYDPATMYIKMRVTPAHAPQRCCKCGEWSFNHSEFEGDFYCDDCWEEYITECDHCGALMLRSEGHWVSNDDFVCEYCWDNETATCDNCGETFYLDDIEYVDGFGQVCIDCRENGNFYWCEECQRWVMGEDWDFDEDMCCECSGNCGLVKSYHSHHGCEDLIGLRSDPAKVGFELEAEGSDEKNTLEAIEGIIGGHVHYERDGSLGSGGVEIISEIHTFDEFEKTDWESMLRTLSEHGYTSHNNGHCGLHFHINKPFFGEDIDDRASAIARLSEFFRVNYDEIVKFSRRNYDGLRWCEPSYEDEFEIIKDVIKGDRYSDNRYRAVNVCNSNTVEIRMMRGTLRPETFKATWDFIKTVITYAKNHPYGDNYDVRSWLSGITVNTWEYIKSRGCFPTLGTI